MPSSDEMPHREARGKDTDSVMQSSSTDKQNMKQPIIGPCEASHRETEPQVESCLCDHINGSPPVRTSTVRAVCEGSAAASQSRQTSAR